MNLLGDGATVDEIAGWHQCMSSITLCTLQYRRARPARINRPPEPITVTRVPTLFLELLAGPSGCRYSVSSPVLMSCNS